MSSPVYNVLAGGGKRFVPDYEPSISNSQSSNSEIWSPENSNIPSLNEILWDLNTYDPIANGISYEALLEQTGINTEPWLEIVEQPCEMFRFRYLTESQGTPHGPVMGSSSSKSKKSFPTVRLHNFKGEAVIRCWLFTTDGNPGPHVHKLVTKMGQKKIKEEPHDLVASEFNNYTVSFENLVIIHAVRKLCYEHYFAKKMNCQSKFSSCQQAPKEKELNNKIINELKKEIGKMNMNIVSLYFEALVQRGSTMECICSAISRPIKNKKNAEYGDLKIVRSDRAYGSCKGGEEVFIFVEKVTRDVKVKFYEEDLSGNITWYDYATFNSLDIHHLVAIAFRTPPYKDVFITSDVTIKYQLERPKDGSYSNSLQFTYKPDEHRPPAKRMRTETTYEIADSTDQIMNLNDFNPESISFSLDLIDSQSKSGNEFYLTGILQDFPEGLVADGPQHIPISNEKIISNPKGYNKVADNCIFVSGKIFFEKQIQKLALYTKDQACVNHIHTILCEYTSKNNNNCIHWAVLLKKEDELTSLLTFIKSFNLKEVLLIGNSKKQTPLHLALRLGYSFCAQQLLEAGSDCNILDSAGYSPFHVAILYHSSFLPSIINYNNDVINCRTKAGVTPLLLAVTFNKLDCLKTLLQNSAVFEACCKTGDTALHIAVSLSSYDIVVELLEVNKTIVNEQNYAGNTSLHISVANNDFKMVKILLKHGANPRIYNFIKSSEPSQLTFDSDISTDSEGDHDDKTGQNVFDLASNKEMLDLLQNYNCSLDNLDTLSIEDKQCLITEKNMKLICEDLDKEKKWVEIAKRLDLSYLISSMETTESPSRFLLNYIDVQGDKNETMEKLIQILNELNLTSVANIISNANR